MGNSGKSKRTGGKNRGDRVTKRTARKTFRLRHIDQVWQDVRKEEGVHGNGVGPVGTTDRVELDDDLPAMGQHYCVPCGRYFISAEALDAHARTKAHKKRCKELAGPAPHSQADADWAAGMGAPDNGPSKNVESMV